MLASLGTFRAQTFGAGTFGVRQQAQPPEQVPEYVTLQAFGPDVMLAGMDMLALMAGYGVPVDVASMDAVAGMLDFHSDAGVVGVDASTITQNVGQDGALSSADDDATLQPIPGQTTIVTYH